MKKFKVIFLFFSVYYNTVNSQIEKDAGLWTTFTLQKKITKKITIAVDQELRLRENFQRLNLFYTNIGVDYKLNKHIKISPSYRFIQKVKIDTRVSYRHRLSADLTYKKKFNKFIISERIRYQIEIRDYLTSKKGKLPEQYVRFKTDFKYNITDKITPYLSCELRFQIRSWRDNDIKYNGDFHRIRNVGGIEYEFNYRNFINVYYLVQNEFNIAGIENNFIFGVAYTLNL